MTFLSHLINGISLGSVYAIIALGYTMVYGIAKMLNFAHGDVIMVGAYICFSATTRFDEWLLGFDENPHETILINIPELEEAKQCLSAIDLLSKSGVEVGQVNNGGRFLPASKIGGFAFRDKDAEVRRGNTVIWSGDIRTLENVLLEICEFALFKVEMLQKRKGG